jgi:hypothetical protein
MPNNQLDRELPAEDYFDLAGNWAITEKASVSLGINNVLDDNPSLSGAVGTVGIRQHLSADLRRPSAVQSSSGRRATSKNRVPDRSIICWSRLAAARKVPPHFFSAVRRGETYILHP